jgi:hypothetical protein
MPNRIMINNEISWVTKSSIRAERKTERGEKGERVKCFLRK